MDFKDYYKALGLAQAASASDIKRVYRKLARQHHPDVSKHADASERMAALNEAHAVLSDPAKRAAYDALLMQTSAHSGRDFQPPPNWDSGEKGDEGFAFADMASDGNAHSDFFEQLFGRAAHARRRTGQAMDLRGSDHHAKIELELLDAYTGANRQLILPSSPPGDARHAQHLQVRIPKGVHEGQYIRLAGRGAPGTGNGPAGDLLLQVVFKPDARWRAEGRDVYQRVALAPWEAMLGVQATISTPTGDTAVSFPPGWHPGRKVRLKGGGIPGSGNHASGNLYIELELSLPPADTQEARAAYQTMAKSFPAFGHLKATESADATS